MATRAVLPPKTEFKSFPFELKSVDEDQGIVIGYLSTFGNVDKQKDRVLPHAFAKTIQEAKARKENGRKYLWPALFMHDPEKPIGGCTDAIEDEHGLLVTMQLDISTNAQGIPSNPLATMVFSGFKSGYIDELSMGYNAIQKDYDQQGVRDLKECRLVESSAVVMNFAANPEALVPASGVKALDLQSQEQEEPPKKRPARKDFNDRYRVQQIKSWLCDLDGWYSALRKALIDMFLVGDQPQLDVLDTVLNNSADNKVGAIQALTEWVQRGIDLDVANYLPDDEADDAVQSLIYYMTRSDTTMQTKAGARFSKDTAAAIMGHVKAMQDVAEQHKAMMTQCKDLMAQHKAMMGQITTTAQDLSNLLGENAYGDDEQDKEPGKSRGPSHSHETPTTQPVLPTTDAISLEDLEAYLRQQLAA